VEHQKLVDRHRIKVALLHDSSNHGPRYHE
jgi:hypothetical protein